MRLLILLSIFAFLGACKVVVSVPEGGRVVSLSGDFACEAGETCTIDVTDTDFDKTFRVEAEAGLQWRWRQFPRGLCGGSQSDCRLATTGFPGNDNLLAILASDQEFYLEPKFWPQGESEVAGLGRGTLTGFGSLIINEQTHLALDDNTRIRLDGDDNPSASDLALGMVLHYTSGDDTTNNLATGTALTVDAISEVKGPITSVNPLRVLAQLVISTGDTVLADLPGGQLNALVVGDELEVHGFRGGNNEINATRIQRKAGGIPVWKLTGTVTGVGTGTFNIGSQEILLGDIAPRDCSGPLAIGDQVEARFARDPGFQPGQALATLSDIECQGGGLPSPANPIASVLAGEFEGVVNRVISAERFEFNGQLVVLKSNTRFRFGTRSDIIPGARLEAEGTFDAVNSVLTAREIKFKGSRVRIEAPLESSGGQISLLGIRLLVTAVTEDEDGILDTLSSRQVEVRGFLDGTGWVVAEQLRERGDPDAGDVRLRGPASDIDGNGFSILGIRIDTDTARAFRNRSGVLIDRATFFQRLVEGAVVSAEDATWDGAGSLRNARIELED
ncbi:hypothetical protein FV139_04570 [Parahaliea maris]|uniref:DUF5666 domain-containing protein n=1 Tax=Parahaliea maris TaxID=2716870 RepID=A0A5C9A344_9GAMM|nr:DUF5666 domain-containing protein [Parahaliea maris]TXS95178.1 hypothetical protein FV139_04570 [Parahaliea maris]